MNDARIDGVLMLIVIGCAAVAIARSCEIVRPIDAPPLAVARAESMPVRDDADSLDAAANAVTEHDPFRFVNRPTGVPYSPHPEIARPITGAPTPVAQSPRPILTLKGIVGGPPWHAIVAGLPGQASDVLVSVGSTFDRFIVRSIGRDTVVVQAPDTSWTLSLRSRE